VTHWRTARSASGEQPQIGPRNVAYSTRDDSNVISLADHFPSRGDRLNSERLTVAPSFIREFAAYALVFLYVMAPAVVVSACVVGYALYALLVAQPVEY
jgi:hypothetical protein